MPAMRKRKIVVILLVVVLLAAALLFVLWTGNNSSSNTETPEPGSESPKPSTEPSPEPTLDLELNTLAEAFATSITIDIAGVTTATGTAATAEEFEDTYINHLINSSKELTPVEYMRKIYSEKVLVTVGCVNEGSAELILTTPDLAAIVTNTVNALIGNTVTNEDIYNDVIEVLQTGTYDTITSTVVVNYSAENGEIAIEKSEEYVNALYGGMLDSLKEYLDVYRSEAGKEGTQ